MIELLKIIALIVNLYFCWRSIKYLRAGNFGLLYIAILLFFSVFTLPLFADIVIGYPEFPEGFINYYISQKDFRCECFYCLFTIFVPAVFFLFRTKYTIRFNFREIVANAYCPRIVLYLLAFMMFLPLLAAFFAPSPSLYFTKYAPFLYESGSSKEFLYHMSTMSLCLKFSFIAVLLTVLFSHKNILFNLLIWLAIFQIGVFSGKRTLFSIAIILTVVLNYFSTSKKGDPLPYFRFFLALTFIFSFFWFYAHTVGKPQNESVYSTTRLYFGRDAETKLAIYSCLYPDRVQILEYPGQSYLFNVLLWVPRAIWEEKPYPYCVYLTNAVFGFNKVELLGWGVTSSWFGESLANFGWLGVIPGILLFIAIAKLTEKTNNALIYFLGLALICYFMVLQLPNFFILLCAWMLGVIYYVLGPLLNKY